MSKDFYSNDHTVQTGAPGSGTGNLKLEGEDSVVITGNRTAEYKGIIEVTDNILVKAREAPLGGSYGEIAIQGSDLTVGTGSPSPVTIDRPCDTTIYGKLSAYTYGSDHTLYTDIGSIELRAVNGDLKIVTPSTTISGNLDISGDLSVSGSVSSSSGISNNGNINISTTNGGDIGISATGYGAFLGPADINMSASTINLNSTDLNITAEDDILITSGSTSSGNIYLKAGGDLGDPFISIIESSGTIYLNGDDLDINLVNDMNINCSGSIEGTSDGLVYFRHSSNNCQFVMYNNNINVIAANPGTGLSLTEAAMTIINAHDSSNTDVLYLKNFYNGTSGNGNNFIAFFDGASGGNDIGSIEGNGTGGISVHSPGADYGEWMPIGDLSEWPEYSGEKNILGIPEGTLVWIKDSKIWRYKGSTPMVVTNSAVICGNKPKNSFHKPTTERGEILSFIGQVPTFVEGQVEDGDLLVPVEGANHTRAINPETIQFSDYRKAVGTAWGKKLTTEVGLVNCAIGIK